MTSATEVLRRLLDERGVEWDYGITGATTTRFNANGVDLTFTPMRDGLVCSTILTPEQAIADTLGATDAKPTQVESSGTCHPSSSNCTNDCTNSERTGTCHDKGTFRSWGYFTCSNCHVVVPVEAVREAPSIGKVVPISYCPNCGRKVVDA